MARNKKVATTQDYMLHSATTTKLCNKAPRDFEILLKTRQLEQKLEVRRKPSQKCHYKKNKTSSLLCRAFTGLRGTFGRIICMAPAHEGTLLFEDERRKHATADSVHDHPGPWCEYERLISDADDEDDKEEDACAKKKARESKRRRRADIIAVTYEDSVAPYYIGVP
ncbi:hypothetical protein F5Y19DRAFT_473851 [Xylariaceae sp. FL1651]|nr:hypothetical protein F5Y19DRAFT_473851 [Xylariaceae sp. FL1651]